ncbi:MAG TPA: hypothetical protein DIT01_08520, partial [Lentisphaeria bacterium]|nr:hypothetical protein [Lentisphaeria bacterium]
FVCIFMGLISSVFFMLSLEQGHLHDNMLFVYKYVFTKPSMIVSGDILPSLVRSVFLIIDKWNKKSK